MQYIEKRLAGPVASAHYLATKIAMKPEFTLHICAVTAPTANLHSL